ncbi:MAG: hypothetical protein E7461_00590 [Ruminococcaceae bacterium]|nr:hypothetical protein [Oscillospiraceae bacterium]
MARTNVKVIGCAKRVVGTKKGTGEVYDFQRFAFSYVNQWGDADLAICGVDTELVQKLGVAVGKTFDASVVTANNRTYIDLLQEVEE